MLTCLINGVTKNLIDDPYDKETWKKWAAKNIVTCPVCNKPYEYCHGRIIPPYFRHKDKVECEDKYAEPETAEHIKGKQDLYQWLKIVPGVTDLDLEHWIEGTHQRPDLYFLYNGKPTVVEYQCSPISTEYYERHELYQAGGINDIWICGTEKYWQKSMARKKEIEKNTEYHYDPVNEVFYIHDCALDNAINSLHFIDRLDLTITDQQINGSKNIPYALKMSLKDMTIKNNCIDVCERLRQQWIRKGEELKQLKQCKADIRTSMKEYMKTKYNMSFEDDSYSDGICCGYIYIIPMYTQKYITMHKKYFRQLQRGWSITEYREHQVEFESVDDIIEQFKKLVDENINEVLNGRNKRTAV